MLLKVIELIFQVRNRCGSGSIVCFAGVCVRSPSVLGQLNLFPLPLSSFFLGLLSSV
jgi:hypothetical protein